MALPIVHIGNLRNYNLIVIPTLSRTDRQWRYLLYILVTWGITTLLLYPHYQGLINRNLCLEHCFSNLGMI